MLFSRIRDVKWGSLEKEEISLVGITIFGNRARWKYIYMIISE